MKKLALLVLLCASFAMVGCDEGLESSPRGVLQTRVERNRRISQAFDIQKRGLQDDIDYALLLDHVNRMNEAHLYCGW